MTQLHIKSHLPIGISWSWVKFSFAVFREKPINFLVFAFSFILFSILPVLGSFLGVIVLVRIYLSAHNVVENKPFGLQLNLGQILRQRNIVSYAIFNMGFDLISMSILSELIKSWGIDSNNAAVMLDSRVLYSLVSLGAFRIIFFGISLAIVTFNPELRVFSAIGLSWQFLIKNLAVVILGLFLLLPFLALPIYIIILTAQSINNGILVILSLLLLLIFMLLFIAVTTIFSYKLYQDGIIHE